MMPDPDQHTGSALARPGGGANAASRMCLFMGQVKVKMFVCWLVDQRRSNMLVYLRDGSAQTI